MGNCIKESSASASVQTLCHMVTTSYSEKVQHQHNAHQVLDSHCYDIMKHNRAKQNQRTQEYWALTQETDQNLGG